MNHVDFLAVEVLVADKDVERREAVETYMSLPERRRAFYKARAAVRHNIYVPS